MVIKGKFEKDSNFITVFVDNRIYTIARNTGEWASVGVGERTAMGQILTQETYDKWVSACSKEAAFELL
ncbi:MAG: hypothetical protein K1W00_03435 [Lachnospiraceae bacterium]